MSANYCIKTATIEDEQRISALFAASYAALMRDGYDDAVLVKALPFMIRAKGQDPNGHSQRSRTIHSTARQYRQGSQR